MYSSQFEKSLQDLLRDQDYELKKYKNENKLLIQRIEELQEELKRQREDDNCALRYSIHYEPKIFNEPSGDKVSFHAPISSSCVHKDHALHIEMRGINHKKKEIFLKYMFTDFQLLYLDHKEILLDNLINHQKIFYKMFKEKFIDV